MSALPKQTAWDAAKYFLHRVQKYGQPIEDIEQFEAGCYGPATGFVYFIGIGGPLPDFIKIGFTKGNPYARMGGLQTGCPHKMGMIGFVFGHLAMESDLHSVLADYRAEGEWFRMSSYVRTIVTNELVAEAA